MFLHDIPRVDVTQSSLYLLAQRMQAFGRHLRVGLPGCRVMSELQGVDGTDKEQVLVDRLADKVC